MYAITLNGHFLVEVVLAGHQNGLKGHTKTLVKVFNLHTCIYIIGSVSEKMKSGYIYKKL